MKAMFVTAGQAACACQCICQCQHSLKLTVRAANAPFAFNVAGAAAINHVVWIDNTAAAQPFTIVDYVHPDVEQK